VYEWWNVEKNRGMVESEKRKEEEEVRFVWVCEAKVKEGKPFI